MKYILMALLISLAGCGVSISPLPGVSIYIPLPSEIGYHGSDKKHHDRDRERHDDHHEHN